MRCPRCGLEQEEGNRFCEDCGAPLASSASSPAGRWDPCPQCGAEPGTVDQAGFCSRCGQERVGPAREHVEVAVAPYLAGVSDRGLHHPRNEDFLALAAEDRGEVLVVCDGVSNSQNPDLASAAAARAACAALLERLRSGELVGPDAMTAALQEAHSVVMALPYRPEAGGEPPETTIVAAVHQRGRLTLGWLGDSRAYFVGQETAWLLTEDHSWVNEVVAAGQMTLDEARRSPLAHCITRTLGGPTHGDGEGAADEPSLRTIDVPDGSGHLLLCSDGLWNYAPEPEQLHELVSRLPAGPDALALARALVEYARGQRGHDNITAAVLAFGHRPAAGARP